MTTKQPGSSEEEWFARREGELKRDGVLERQRGELEQLAGREPGFLQKIVGAFRGG